MDICKSLASEEIEIWLPPCSLPLCDAGFWGVKKDYYTQWLGHSGHFVVSHFTSVNKVWLLFCIKLIWSPLQCHEPPSIVLQAFCLSDLIPQIYLSLPLYNRKGFDLHHNWMGLVVFPTFFNLSLNFATRSSWSEPQSAPGLVFADCTELLHLQLQRI